MPTFDDLLRRSAWRYPRPIEEAFFAHPHVRVCGVVGAPDPVLGAVPTVFVESQGEVALDKDELLTW